MLHLGQVAHLGAALHHVHMVFSGTAAAVAEAVEHQCLMVDGALPVLIPGAPDRSRVRVRRIVAQRGHMDQHLAVIQTRPQEAVVGELIVPVPAELDGHEVVHAAFPDDLRQGGRIAEDIGEPEGLHIETELTWL